MLLEYFIISSNLLLFDGYSTPKWRYEGCLEALASMSPTSNVHMSYEGVSKQANGNSE